MKVGDKLVCIQTNRNHQWNIIHLKGTRYTIIKIIQDIIYIDTENSYPFEVFGYWDQRLSNYFTTIKMERKLKLEKISEQSSYFTKSKLSEQKW